MRENEVICLGMAVTDILVKGVTKIEMKGQTTFVETIEMQTGGDAVNEAITLANLGHGVRLMTLVGDDAQGKFLVQSLKEQKVDVEGVAISNAYPTSTSVVLIGENGERSFLSRKGATADEYSIAHMNLNLIDESVKLLSIASLFCSEKLNEGELVTILKKAKEVGAIAIADLVLNREDCRLEDIKEALYYLDYIVPSFDEAKYFSGKEQLEDIAAVFHSYGIPNVIIKLGADGVWAHTKDGQVSIRTYTENVVDTTGAGDNFMAGFISGILREKTLTECLKFGSAVSAISIGKVGATGAISSREQVEQFLKERGEE